MTTIAGSVALVTGGQRGLGRAFAEELLRRGAAKVYATARNPQPDSDSRIVPVPLDVTDPASVTALAATAGDVDILINNAGVLLPAPLLSGDIADVIATFDTNVFGPLRVIQAFAPILAARGGGALVDIHSVLSWGAGAAAYGASKAAFWSLTNSVRIELAAQRTQVTGVHLAFADTDMVRDLPFAKIAPERVAASVCDGVELGESEVLVDEITRTVKAALSGPVEGLTIPLSR
ncbi:short-chain dehydrogenase [Nocardia neocaledoniensis NBRC 108232]|uniref:NADP-dependent 3-hydroxy acid dehydrogenase YdfG n=1 Tax=Nocardia neocaledoniensis TaxID=236511 RepID=A0A317N6P2_9NOCA|nr:SDR family oxidoreductase [Nocardia neocaledoniensis]PWV70754.1 NADP-dependent 3-hydroxy acid dehydrogenase YdfG [Nocardia neocaledoniensis]GEM30413.1 short-chain dehydrogenase [Nocardia neocaledoniensis NBRC 108232]